VCYVVVFIVQARSSHGTERNGLQNRPGTTVYGHPAIGPGVRVTARGSRGRSACAPPGSRVLLHESGTVTDVGSVVLVRRDEARQQLTNTFVHTYYQRGSVFIRVHTHTAGSDAAPYVTWPVVQLGVLSGGSVFDRVRPSRLFEL
jgi:hypothetical protein